MKTAQLTKPTTATEAPESAPMENGPLTRRKAVSRAAGALAAVAGLLTFRRIQASPVTVSWVEAELAGLRREQAEILAERRVLLSPCKTDSDFSHTSDAESELHGEFWEAQNRIDALQASPVTTSGMETELRGLRRDAAEILRERQALMSTCEDYAYRFGDEESELHEKYWRIQDRIVDVLNGW